jgi:hypothetical protein
MKTRRSTYALAAIAVFAVEVAIAFFAHDRFVRPYVGDSLAVVLVYLALRASRPMRMEAAIAMALAIAFAIEVGQLFGLVGALGLGASRVARIILGGGFDPMDFIAYIAGAPLAFWRSKSAGVGKRLVNWPDGPRSPWMRQGFYRRPILPIGIPFADQPALSRLVEILAADQPAL